MGLIRIIDTGSYCEWNLCEESEYQCIGDQGKSGRNDECGCIRESESYIGEITPTQGLVFRMGMVLIPVIALVISYIIIREKYHIDEKEYEQIIQKTKMHNFFLLVHTNCMY